MRPIKLIKQKSRERGNSVIEFTLLLPWLLFLFMGVFDFGFYTYALISMENAARVAAVRAAANSGVAADQHGACALAIEELRGLPNIGQTFNSPCNSDPVTVTSVYCDDSTPCAAGLTSADSGPAVLVTVTYQMPALFRVPIRGLSRLSQTAQMRLRDTLQ